MCKKPLPPGCDCDPYDSNPDSFCQGGQVCKVHFKITFKSANNDNICFFNLFIIDRFVDCFLFLRQKIPTPLYSRTSGYVPKGL